MLLYVEWRKNVIYCGFERKMVSITYFHREKKWRNCKTISYVVSDILSKEEGTFEAIWNSCDDNNGMKWRPLPEKTNSPLNGKQYLRNPKVFLFHSQINMDVIRVGYKEWVNAVERLLNSCQWGPLSVLWVAFVG